MANRIKITIPDKEFEKMYNSMSPVEVGKLLNVDSRCVVRHAKRLDITPFLSMKYNPNVIPGGLPEEE